eukprot:CAMPEP_0185774710 /NCGR_PEP_ID=MMETSP1174-20130828/79481_1 /TAXON_ID=35687 /ORGANISM="Dictyocha speculum, Strain CCMP1381" /LENGTH=180 /DNA_ID=CAMNT_0028462021 /DNA_START=306 /DNA_END=848 /DNA_ORIENTATION=-
MRHQFLADFFPLHLKPGSLNKHQPTDEGVEEKYGVHREEFPLRTNDLSDEHDGSSCRPHKANNYDDCTDEDRVAQECLEYETNEASHVQRKDAVAQNTHTLEERYCASEKLRIKRHNCSPGKDEYEDSREDECTLIIGCCDAQHYGKCEAYNERSPEIPFSQFLENILLLLFGKKYNFKL